MRPSASSVTGIASSTIVPESFHIFRTLQSPRPQPHRSRQLVRRQLVCSISFFLALNLCTNNVKVRKSDSEFVAESEDIFVYLKM